MRVGLIESYCALLTGDERGRAKVVEILRSGPAHIDEIYSAGYSNLTYFDVEQRRLDQAADMLDVDPVDAGTRSADLPGVADGLAGEIGPADRGLGEGGSRCRYGARRPQRAIGPHVATGDSRARRAAQDGGGADDLDEAWRLACRYGEPMRTLPAAAAVAERAWLTGCDDERLDECARLLETAPPTGLEWARGELAVWLRRAGRRVNGVGLAEPYQFVMDGAWEAAAEQFGRLGTPYDAAMALIIG